MQTMMMCFTSRTPNVYLNETLLFNQKIETGCCMKFTSHNMKCNSPFDFGRDHWNMSSIMLFLMSLVMLVIQTAPQSPNLTATAMSDDSTIASEVVRLLAHL
jgi:hypothetical protein